MLNKWWLNRFLIDWKEGSTKILVSHSSLLLFFLFFSFLSYSYVRLFRTVTFYFILYTFLTILYLLRVKRYVVILVTQSATKQFVQKHSYTSASHLASNHPLTELSWPSIVPNSQPCFTLPAISCLGYTSALQREIEETKVALLLAQTLHTERETRVALCSLPFDTLDLWIFSSDCPRNSPTKWDSVLRGVDHRWVTVPY